MSSYWTPARLDNRPIDSVIFDCDGDPWTRTTRGYRDEPADGSEPTEWTSEVLVKAFGPLTLRHRRRTRSLILADALIP